MGKCKTTLLFIWMLLFIQGNIFSNNEPINKQINSDTIQVYFRFDNSEIEKTYRSNYRELQKLDSIVSRHADDLDSITITSYASIEGDSSYNYRLSKMRSESSRTYLVNTYPGLNAQTRIFLKANGEDWNGLLDQAYERKWIPDRMQLISILENKQLTHAEKKKQIYALKDGEVFDYLTEYVLWRLRNTSSIILWHKKTLERISPQITEMVPVRQEKQSISDRIKDLPGGKMKVKSPLFALKSNLLFDAATIVNLEFEFPVRRQFSIAGEWTFPFWKAPKSDLTLNLLYGKLDCKYWLGDRLSKPVMIGWFCDVYGGYGKYDFQPFSEKGVQGTFFNVGIGAGYAHAIHKNLRLEYAIGLGYIRTEYNKYDRVKDTAYGDIKVVRYPWKRFHYNWIGPTKLAVSLVWIINREKFK